MTDKAAREHIRAALAALVRAESLSMEKDREQNAIARTASGYAMAPVVEGFNAIAMEVSQFPYRNEHSRVRCDVEVLENHWGTVARLHFDREAGVDLAEQTITVGAEGGAFTIKNFRLGFGTQPQETVLASVDDVLLMATQAAAHWIALRNGSTSS